VTPGQTIALLGVAWGGGGGGGGGDILRVVGNGSLNMQQGRIVCVLNSQCEVLQFETGHRLHRASAHRRCITCQPQVWPALMFHSRLHAWYIIGCMLAGVKHIHLC
jgi:hypothetical protein